MKLKYLGTAAAEGIPALFCHCPTCKQARRRGGRDLRTRSQALVDGKILIDWNADNMYHSFAFGVDYAAVNTLLITHVHEDHFYPKEFVFRTPSFSHIEDCNRLTVYGSEDIVKDTAAYVDTQPMPYGINVQTVSAFVPFEAEGYRITPLTAQHGTDHPYFYCIEKDGKALLYAHDTGLFPEEDYAYIAGSKIKFDLVSLDCTAGNMLKKYDSHMNLEQNDIVCERLRDIGAIDDHTKIVVNHFSHNATNVLYDEMNTLAIKRGYTVSYDGLEIEF